MTTATNPQAPQLKGDALAAVQHRGSHLQIIASAGSGKTEVVSQRVADLLADGVPAAGIVAFTFTERAAAELKNRIALRVAERLGADALDRLGGLFVGTIHAYCFRLLQTHVSRYETYDVLDDHQLTAFLSREAKRLEIRQLDPNSRLFASIARFVQSVEVVENELLDRAVLPEPFRGVLAGYFETLERYRLLTYGQQIVRAVTELSRPAVAAAVHADLRHLIVDEYQDVNPAQERLIELLTGPQVELCVVGDDDQAVYQWRGSDVANIVDFADRYPNVACFEITTNRRSRPGIVRAANRFAQTIPGRLPKAMTATRPAEDGDVVVWSAEDELAEAGHIAALILDANDAGVPYRDMAVLVRSRAAYRRLIEQFATFGIPVQPGGRTGLFDQPEAQALGRTVCWLADIEWRDPYGPPAAVTEDDLLDRYQAVFELDDPGRRRLRKFLREWKLYVRKESRIVDLVGELYELLDELAVRDWDLGDPILLNRTGTLARFSALLADYESVRRRARADHAVPGEQVGGQDRGAWYYKNLAIHIVNYAQGAYEGFDGEPGLMLDAVDLTTVHGAKGLEWPLVFVPSLTAGRFPTPRTGQAQDWLVPRDLFDAARYEGSDADERRLFYVAVTRARDWVSVSRHARVTKQSTRPSPYYTEIAADHEIDVDDIVLPPIGGRGDGDEPISVTYSELAAYLGCAMAYRLRNLVGFQPRLAPELGYGKAVHHVLRAVAEATQAAGAIPDAAALDDLLDKSFFLPAANKAAHRELKRTARELIDTYVTDHADDLYRVWETERAFELHLPGITVTGRADVILDQEDGVPTALAIVDYKTSTGGDMTPHELQLQVYTDAGRRERLDVRGAYVHDLSAKVVVDRRIPVDVTSAAVCAAETKVTDAADRLRARDYTPNPDKARCRRCEVRTICPASRS